MIILNESKIKYERLDELLESKLMDIRFSEQVNIIVDLKEVVKKFFRPDIIPEADNYRSIIKEISSDIINIVAHYRNYFYKKNKYTSFYFLYSFNKCSEMINIRPDYKKEYYEKYFDSEANKMKIARMSSVIKTVQKVINILPHCRFIDTSAHDELVYIKYLKESFPTNQMTIILTNDEIMFQLLSSNVFILNLKGIKSNLVTSENAIQILTKKDEYTFSSNLIPLLIAISGNKKYCFKGITHVALIKGATIIKQLLERGLLLDVDSIAMPLDFNKLNPAKSKMDKSLFDNRWQISKSYSLIRNDENYSKNRIAIMTEINSKIQTPKHYSYLLDLNAKIFVSYPLQIDMLLKGEKYEK